MTRAVNMRQEPHDVYIGRGPQGVIPQSPELRGYFGNPFVLKNPNDAQERVQVLQQYREWFLARIQRDPVFRQAVLGLKGKRLGCFCKPRECHGDVIAAWLEAQP